MAYRIITNSKYQATTILITSNSTITVYGNSSASNVAVDDEMVTGASIAQMWFGSPSGNAAYWEIKRGSNTVFVADSTAYLDFRGNGKAIDLDANATLVATLNNATAGTLIIELRKQGTKA